MLLEFRVTCRASWKQSAMYISDWSKVPEKRNKLRERLVRFLDNLRSQNQRRVVLWVVDELGDGKFEL